MIRQTLVTVAAAWGLLLASAAPALAAQPYPLNFHTFDLASGTPSGVTYSRGAVRLASTGLQTQSYADPFTNFAGDGVDGSGSYQYGTWTSPTLPLSFPFNELVSSWNATTPLGTWIQSEVQPQLGDGHWGKWYILGRWASDDSDF